MATASRQRTTREIEYATGDGKPMAETDVHRDDMVDAIQMLKDHFADHSDVYVTGNLLLFYEEGDPRKHVAPDVFVVRGVEKKDRDHYLVWKEGKAPDLVIEITSKTTRREDQKKKKDLYRDVLRVGEYFQFDPTEDYLEPPLQGFRLIEGEYMSIEPVNGRLPSEVLGLHLERDGKRLRLFNPATGGRLLTAAERNELAERRADEERQRAEAAEAVRQQFAAENDRLRKEIEAMRRGSNSH
jgi:Uma2 family endonuclease